MDPDRRGTSDLAGVGQLLADARQAGLSVESDLAVASEDVPATAGTTAFRIVQESLTNVIRHARATRVTVSTQLVQDRLVISVVDNGIAARGATVEFGEGINGMRERAALLGGELTVGQGPDGFRVEARLPIRSTEGFGVAP